MSILVFDPPFSEGITDSLSAILYLEFVQNSPHVKANRGFLYIKSQSDLAVFTPERYEFENFKFPVAQAFLLELNCVHGPSPFR